MLFSGVLWNVLYNLTGTEVAVLHMHYNTQCVRLITHIPQAQAFMHKCMFMRKLRANAHTFFPRVM